LIATDLHTILTRAAAGHDLEELHRAAMAAWAAHRKARRLLLVKATRLRATGCGALAVAYESAAADVGDLAPERVRRAGGLEP
jgi:hypothetical protein